MDSILARVITIVLVLLGIAGVAYISIEGFSGNKTENFSADISSINTSVHSMFAGSNFYTNVGQLTPDVMQGVSRMVKKGDGGQPIEGGALVDPWGNALTVEAGSKAGAGFNDTQLVIIDSGTSWSSSQCSAAVKSATAASEIEVNNTVVYQNGVQQTAELSSQCGSATHSALFVFGD